MNANWDEENINIQLNNPNEQENEQANRQTNRQENRQANGQANEQSNGFKNNALLLRGQMKSKNDKLKIISFVVVFVLCSFFIPIMICDLYYGTNDKSCVSTSAEPLSINLQDYLIVSGYMTFSILITLMAVGFCLGDCGFEGCCGCLSYFLIFLVCLGFIFKMVWDIIGGVIFWAYMDNTKCSNSTFNYVTASLIIKYVCYFISSTQSNNQK